MAVETCAISIIVPIYKVEEYLPKCIESILSQTYKSFELILVEDGSPDQCPAICDEYAAKDSRIKVVHRVNGGLVSARKVGFTHAKGAYVTFVDGDDWIDENYLEQIDRIIKHSQPDVVAVTDFYSTTDDKDERISVGGQYAGMYDKAKLSSDFYPYMFSYSPKFKFGIAPSLCTKIIRRDILEKSIMNVPENIRMGEDLAVSLPCMIEAENIYFTNICGYHYRQNPNSMTNTFDGAAPERVYTLLQTLREEMLQYPVCNIETQIALYAVFITEFTLVSLIKGSPNMESDLERFCILYDEQLLQIGMKKKIPLKTKIVLLMAKYRQIWLLKLVRWLKSEKKTNDVK